MINTAKNFLIMLNNLLQMYLILLQKSNSKSSRNNCSKIVNRITKVSRRSPQNNSQIMNHEERIMKIVKLDLKLQC